MVGAMAGEIGPKGTVDGSMIRIITPKDLALQKDVVHRNTPRAVIAHRGRTSYGLNAMAAAMATAMAALAM